MEKILIVDDEKMNRSLLKHIFEEQYEVLEAANGVEAIELLDSNIEEIQVVFLDLLMPVMDGFATLTSIRQRETLRDLPIIILTGTRHKEKVIKGITSGVEGYIVKPANSEQLLAKIESVLSA